MGCLLFYPFLIRPCAPLFISSVFDMNCHFIYTILPTSSHAWKVTIVMRNTIPPSRYLFYFPWNQTCQFLYDGQGVQFSTFAKKHVKWHLLLKQWGIVRISPWLWGFLYLTDLEIGYNHVIFASLEHTLNIYPPSWPIIFYVPSSKVRFPFGFSSYSGTLSLLYQETCSSYSCSALPKFPELSTLELPLNCSSVPYMVTPGWTFA